MKYLSVSQTAEKWGISEKTVRNYCAKNMIDGAYLKGKTWNIPEDAQKPKRANKKNSEHMNLLKRLTAEKVTELRGGFIIKYK